MCCEREKLKPTRMELVTLAWPFAGDCRDKSGDSFCNRKYKIVPSFYSHRICKDICQCLFLIPYLTRHGLGPVTRYDLEGDATSHLLLCGQEKKCMWQMWICNEYNIIKKVKGSKTKLLFTPNFCMTLQTWRCITFYSVIQSKCGKFDLCDLPAFFGAVLPSDWQRWCH